MCEGGPLRRIWEAVTTGVPGPLPEGISLTAARHRMAVPLYRVLESADALHLLSDGDRRLLLAASGYHALRSRQAQRALRSASRSHARGWATWKAGALLLLVPGYWRCCEAADLDVVVEPGAVHAWRDRLARIGDITKERHEGGRLIGFQARVRTAADIDLVWDVLAVKELPPAIEAAGVPVVERKVHLGMLRAHVEAHSAHPDGCRLRMFYDARLVGAFWADALCEELVLSNEIRE